jgi:hypothetical protein
LVLNFEFSFFFLLHCPFSLLLAIYFLLSSCISCFLTSLLLACRLHFFSLIVSVLMHLLVSRSFVLYFIVSLPSYLHYFSLIVLVLVFFLVLICNSNFCGFLTPLLHYGCYYIVVVISQLLATIFFNDIFIVSFVHVFCCVFSNLIFCL